MSLKVYIFYEFFPIFVFPHIPRKLKSPVAFAMGERVSTKSATPLLPDK